MVRRTSLWTVGRIFENLHLPDVHPQLVTQDDVAHIVTALLNAMVVDTHMALKACYAVQQLADGFSPADERHELTPYFAQIAERLLQVLPPFLPLSPSLSRADAALCPDRRAPLSLPLSLTPYFAQIAERLLQVHSQQYTSV